MAFFLSIAFAFRGSKTLKGLSYTMMILGAVSIAMYHPQYFKTIGDYKLSALIIPLLQIIMFGMGTELSLKDFANVMSYLARANLALSISVTTISTILAPFLTPLLMRLLGGSFVEINFWNMVWDITKIVILPVTAGLAFHYLVHGKFKWLDKAMPFLSMAGIAIILTIITAAGRDNLIKVGALLIVATILHNVLGYILGYWSARLLRFQER